MAKAKTAFVCNDCGAEYARWQGQCNACKAWNTITEIRLAPAKASRADRFSGYAGETQAKIQTLAEISLQEVPRFHSGFYELDRVLGGGDRAGQCDFDRRTSRGREKYSVITSDVWFSTKYDRTLCYGRGILATGGDAC